MSAEMKIVFYRALALEGEASDEKHKEISKSSPSLFQKNPKDFGLPLFAIFNFFNAKFSRVISSSDQTDY